MKKFAKLLAMVLAVSMVLTMFVGAYDYKDAADIDEDKAAAVDAVYEAGIMQGNTKGEFNPKDLLARDEMAKIMYALVDKGVVSSLYSTFAGTYADVDTIRPWAKAYVGYAAANQLFVGDAAGNFNGSGNISYIEAATVLLRALDQEEAYIDLRTGEILGYEYSGSKWITNVFNDAMDAELFDGLEDVEGLLKTSTKITREDMAVMINNAIAFEATLGDEYFVLTEKKSGVVVDTAKVDDVDCFVIDGSDVAYAIGELEVDEYIGKEVKFYVEDDEVISALEIVNATVYNTTIGGIALDDKGNLTIDGNIAIKADKFAGYDAGYIFQNSTQSYTSKIDADVVAELLDMVDYEVRDFMSNNAITVIVNGNNSISVIYSPLFFIKGSQLDGVQIVEEVKDNKYTGKYFVQIGSDKLYIPVDLLKVEDDQIVALKLEGDEIIIDGLATYVDVEKISANKKTVDNAPKYTFKYNGETLLNATASNALFPLGQLTALNDAELFDALLEKDYVIVYNNMVLGVANEAAPASTTEYVFVLNVESNIEKGQIVHSVYAIVNGELTTLKIADIAQTEFDAVIEVGSAYKLITLGADITGSDGTTKFVKGTKYLSKITDFASKTANTIDLFDGKYVNGNKFTITVAYDANTDTMFDVKTIAIEDGIATIDGKKIYAPALTLFYTRGAAGQEFLLFVYNTK